jgi:predicted Rossmann fold nucleotide-binding protein DprA/Smf involved in DNA uptake
MRRLKKKLGQSAPPPLYGAGEMSLPDVGGLAVVGSRNASEAALELTHEVARACARDGLGVVSGGAKGVDVAAMQSAGEAGGVVIGVLAADLLRASVNR